MAFTTIIMWAVSAAVLSVNWRLPETTPVINQTIMVETPVMQTPLASHVVSAAATVTSSVAASSAVSGQPFSGYLALAILLAVIALCFVVAHAIGSDISILQGVGNGEELKRLQGLFFSQEVQLGERDLKIKALRVQEDAFTAALLFRHKQDLDNLSSASASKFALMRNDATRADALTSKWCQRAHYYQAMWRRCFQLADSRIVKLLEVYTALCIDWTVARDLEQQLRAQVKELQARINRLEQDKETFQGPAILDLTLELAAKEKDLAILTAKALQHNLALQAKDTAIQAKDHQIAALSSLIAQHNESLNSKDDLIATLEEEKGEAWNDSTRKIAKLEGEKADLAEKVRDLETAAVRVSDYTERNAELMAELDALKLEKAHLNMPSMTCAPAGSKEEALRAALSSIPPPAPPAPVGPALFSPSGPSVFASSSVSSRVAAPASIQEQSNLLLSAAEGQSPPSASGAALPAAPLPLRRRPKPNLFLTKKYKAAPRPPPPPPPPPPPAPSVQ